MIKQISVIIESLLNKCLTSLSFKKPFLCLATPTLRRPSCYAHTTRAPAPPIPSGRGGLIYGIRWRWWRPRSSRAWSPLREEHPGSKSISALPAIRLCQFDTYGESSTSTLNNASRMARLSLARCFIRIHVTAPGPRQHITSSIAHMWIVAADCILSFQVLSLALAPPFSSLTPTLA
jgi:hypothetical protein